MVKFNLAKRRNDFVMSNGKSEGNLIERMLSILSLYESDAFHDEAESPAAVRNSEMAKQIQAFIDEIPGGFLIYRAGADEQIIYANKALIKIFKCNNLAEFRKLTGNSFKGMVHPDDLDTVEKSIAEQIASSRDNLDYVEYRITDKNGVVRWVEDYGHFVHTETAGDVYYVFIGDATEKITRRMSETAALLNEKLEKEKKLKNIIKEYDKERKLITQEHLQRLEVIEGLSVNYDSILYADLNENMVLPYRLSTRLERQFEKKLQVREFNWFVSDYVNVWVHPEDRALVAKMTSCESIIEKLAESPTYYLNYRCIQNNEVQYIQLRIVNVGSSENVSQIVMGYRNIDEEILQQIKQKQFLEDALNASKLAYVAKNTFLSNMSHDMRTPLNAIFGYTSLAQKNAQNPALVTEYLNKIGAASNQILELTNKVLEITYSESQDFHINETECNVLQIIGEAVSSVSAQANQKNISVNVIAPQIEHADVFADKDKLLQILSHIVNNAVKYTKNGGSVSLSVSEQRKPNSEFSTYKFSVEDTGIGISKKSLKRIFEPFEREHNTTLCGVYGSGLGLTIAKHITEMMGGTIKAQSTVGKGSVFTVILSFRLRQKTQSPHARHDEPSEELRGKKILLVEDNEINLEIETDILQDMGFCVDTAENGQIAVDKVAASCAGDYDLILMDIQMPVMDGLKATATIRKLPNPAHSRIPIIALSANAFESDKRTSMEIGMDAYLTKPLDGAEHIASAAAILRGRKAEA